MEAGEGYKLELIAHGAQFTLEFLDGLLVQLRLQWNEGEQL